MIYLQDSCTIKLSIIVATNDPLAFHNFWNSF